MTLERTFKELAEELSETEIVTRQSDAVTSTCARVERDVNTVLPMEMSVLRYLNQLHKENEYKGS